MYSKTAIWKLSHLSKFESYFTECSIYQIPCHHMTSPDLNDWTHWWMGTYALMNLASTDSGNDFWAPRYYLREWWFSNWPMITHVCEIWIQIQQVPLKVMALEKVVRKILVICPGLNALKPCKLTNRDTTRSAVTTQTFMTMFRKSTEGRGDFLKFLPCKKHKNAGNLVSSDHDSSPINFSHIVQDYFAASGIHANANLDDMVE